MPIIRKAHKEDREPVWQIIREVITKGDTYVFEPDSSRKDMLDYWFGNDKHTFVALLQEEVVGTFIIKDNQPGLGSHIANASFMVSEKASGQGIGRKMGTFALEEARRLGYRAMQFNMVVSSNYRAVHLWQSLGFEIIGEVPEAFRHPEAGLISVYIMHRRL
ncbi:MAG: N-acetyltransferase family protein [Cyclobacteriaceae bacterium]